MTEPSTQKVLQEALALLDSGQFVSALHLLESAAEVNSDKAFVPLKLRGLVGVGQWHEAIAIGVGALNSLGNAGDSATLGEIHGHLGSAYLRCGSIGRAERHFRAAFHILTWEVGDVAAAIKQQRRLAVMFLGQGRWQQARAELEAALACADELEISREAIGLRINLAALLLKSGDPTAAGETLSGADCLEGHSKLQLLWNLVQANYLRVIGHPLKAMDLLPGTLQAAREGSYSREEAITLEYMGDCHLAQREFKKALEQYELALKIAEATAPEGDIIPELCHRMGETKVRLGDPNAAIVLCERGFRVARASNDRYEECATHRVYAMAHRTAGNHKKALRIADEGIGLGRRYEIPYELGRMLVWAGEMRVEDSSPDEQAHGRRLLWEARGIFDRVGLSQWIASIDRLLGFDSQQGSVSEESALVEIETLGDLDRGSLRFGIVTRNEKICEAVEILQSVAPSQIPVLITGESGVGKDLLAQALHQMGPRRKGPFVPVNCGAISVNLLDSEFFGHERGAFTGAISSREGLLASSDKGTLFLDEVGDLPLQVQAALLRVLETGEIRAVGRDDVRKVDIRIVAATNAGLEDLVSRSAFRQDLFYRLNGVRISVPPLREREEDIQALFRFFWVQACASAKKRLKVDEAVESMLGAYDWPGNVRELRHEIARAVALAADGTTVGPDAFLLQLKRRDVGSLRRNRDQREEVSEERQEILLALRAHRGNKAEAARSLGGMKRTTLIYKIERLGIRPEE